MHNDLRRTFQRLGCYLLALIMAGSIVVAAVIGIGSAMLRTEKYIQSRMEPYNSQLLAEVDNAIENVAQDTGLPTKAYTQSVREGHIKTVLHQVSGNLVYGYKTDFSDSKYLFGYYRTGIINFCKENGIAITDDEVVRASCFAVDAFNQVCGDESTGFIILFQRTYTKTPLFAIILSIVAFLACVIILTFFTYGRHKRYDYIGMGVSTGGAVLVFLPLFAILMKYSSTLNFTDVDVYNMGIADIMDGIFMVYMAVGAVVFIIGTTILMFNYRYYKKKEEQIRTEHMINKKLRQEFMNDHRAAQEQIDRDALQAAIDQEAMERAVDGDTQTE